MNVTNVKEMLTTGCLFKGDLDKHGVV